MSGTMSFMMTSALPLRSSRPRIVSSGMIFMTTPALLGSPSQYSSYAESSTLSSTS
jgi:hypothetical protein